MKTQVIIWLVIMSIALVVCTFFARRSQRRKAISFDVVLLLVSLLMPIIGNLLIITSGNNWFIARVGHYVFDIGLDWTIISLLRFTCDYCNIKYFGSKLRYIANAIIAIDIIQLLVNPLTGHAFTTQLITVEGAPYYELIPYWGQIVHYIVIYGFFFASVSIFTYKTLTSALIYLERYLVILIVLALTGIWESYYLLSGTPVDLSMIGYGFSGMLIFYFAIVYKPMRLLDRMLARVVSGLNTAVFFFDTSGTCIYANAQARQVAGLCEDGDLEDDATEIIGAAIGGWPNRYNQDWSDTRLIGEGDNLRYLDLDVKQVFDSQKHHMGASLAVRDITEEQEKLQRERYLATHDPLTGLYNHRYLLKRARRLLDQNPEINYCAVAVDVREFKLLNDIFGKEFGDHALCLIADDLRKYSVEGEVYGRFSGDKFGFIVPADKFPIDSVEEVMIAHDFSDRGINHPIIIHIGVYDIVDRSLPIEAMFDRAFMAIASIKSNYHQRLAHYDHEVHDRAVWNQRISAELDEALAAGQIKPYLQPMVNGEGNVEGAEVLARWIHPKEGLLSPARFIPFFEENGRIAHIDLFMWENACQILQQWKRKEIDLFLSVNISPKDFFFLDVRKELNELVKRYDIDPARLRLEITETAMMADLESRLQTIENLRNDGFLIEMDDFGSGFSSLNTLKDIRFDVVKIDMMFLYKTDDPSRAETILQAIINLSTELNMLSVTEGVETSEQLAMLVDMGCHLFQGYYFARPMPLEEFEGSYCPAA